jgi:2-amino-4-hydroxy-6-hydroxymethyldihydropteridine diphosphokinase
MKHRIFLGLGSNLGNREENLTNAIERIRNRIGVIISQSSVIQTAPWGVTDQPDYLNMVIEAETAHWPLRLIAEIMKIEQDMGRIRVQKWGSRIIDIDLLFFNDWYFYTPELIVPHPFICQREFVLKPLFEIAPDFIHPVIRKKISDLI